MFWGYMAGFALIAVFVGLLAARLSALEKRLQRLDPPE